VWSNIKCSILQIPAKCANGENYENISACDQDNTTKSMLVFLITHSDQLPAEL